MIYIALILALSGSLLGVNSINEASGGCTVPSFPATYGYIGGNKHLRGCMAGVSEDNHIMCAYGCARGYVPKTPGSVGVAQCFDGTFLWLGDIRHHQINTKHQFDELVLDPFECEPSFTVSVPAANNYVGISDGDAVACSDGLTLGISKRCAVKCAPGFTPLGTEETIGFLSSSNQQTVKTSDGTNFLCEKAFPVILPPKLIGRKTAWFKPCFDGMVLGVSRNCAVKCGRGYVPLQTDIVGFFGSDGSAKTFSGDAFECESTFTVALPTKFIGHATSDVKACSDGMVLGVSRKCAVKCGPGYTPSQTSTVGYMDHTREWKTLDGDAFECVASDVLTYFPDYFQGAHGGSYVPCQSGVTVTAAKPCAVECASGYQPWIWSDNTVGYWHLSGDVLNSPSRSEGTMDFKCERTYTLSHMSESFEGVAIDDVSACAVGVTLSESRTCAVQCATGYSSRSQTEIVGFWAYSGPVTTTNGAFICQKDLPPATTSAIDSDSDFQEEGTCVVQIPEGYVGGSSGDHQGCEEGAFLEDNASCGLTCPEGFISATPDSEDGLLTCFSGELHRTEFECIAHGRRRKL